MMFPKGRTRRQEKDAAARREAKVKKEVREECVHRDGYCRLRGLPDVVALVFGKCEGASEWAHMTEKRRSRTVGQAPEKRHCVEGSLMLCTRHHTMYDRSQLLIEAVDAARGARGLLRYKAPGGGVVYEEQEAEMSRYDQAELDRRTEEMLARRSSRPAEPEPPKPECPKSSNGKHQYGTYYKSSSGRRTCTACGYVTEGTFDALGVADRGGRK
jgi:hypothetical protein